MRFYSPLRYPGGKTFLASEIKGIIEKIGLDRPTYIEPYAGGAGAALSLLFNDEVERIEINDFDGAIYSFWKSVVEEPERFARKILRTPVTITEWRKQKQIYLDDNTDTFRKGFATFFLNRTNRSGVMNAWPIGGINQSGTYKINARYNKKDLAARVRKIGRYKSRIKVFNEEGIEFTERCLKRENTFIYLDPPYFKKGAMLYLNYYREVDHKELAKLLNRNARHHYWILTYDWARKTLSFYPKRNRKQLDLNYRVRGSRRAKEVMFSSNPIKI